MVRVRPKWVEPNLREVAGTISFHWIPVATSRRFETVPTRLGRTQMVPSTSRRSLSNLVGDDRLRTVLFIAHHADEDAFKAGRRAMHFLHIRARFDKEADQG